MVPNIKNNEGYTSLTYAVLYSDSSMVLTLLSYGADITVLDAKGRNLLEILKSREDDSDKEKIEGYLIDAGLK